MMEIVLNLSVIFTCLVIIITLYVINLMLPEDVRKEKLVLKNMKIWEKIYSNNIKLSTFILLITFMIVAILWLFFGVSMKVQDIGQGIFIETFGMLLDVLLVLLLYNFINSKGEKENLIKEYIEEINDFSAWKSDEAKHKIRRNIKKLNKLNYTNFSLFRLNLNELELIEAKFNNSSLVEVDFSNANLIKSNFSEVQCFSSIFYDAKLALSNFSKCNLQTVNFEKASLVGSDFSDTTLSKVNFGNSDLRGVIFKNSYFYNANFDEAEVNEDFIERLQQSNIFGNPIYEMYEVRKRSVNGYEQFRFYAKKKKNHDNLLKEVRQKM